MAKKKQMRRSDPSDRWKSDNRPSLQIPDTDEGAESSLLEDEVNTATADNADKIYLDSGSNWIVLTNRDHMTSSKKVQEKFMNTANKGRLKVTAVGKAGVHDNIYYAPDGSKNLTDILSITRKGYNVVFDGEHITITNKSTEEVLLHERNVNGLHALI